MALNKDISKDATDNVATSGLAMEQTGPIDTHKAIKTANYLDFHVAE